MAASCIGKVAPRWERYADEGVGSPWSVGRHCDVFPVAISDFPNAIMSCASSRDLLAICHQYVKSHWLIKTVVLLLTMRTLRFAKRFDVGDLVLMSQRVKGEWYTTTRRRCSSGYDSLLLMQIPQPNRSAAYILFSAHADIDRLSPSSQFHMR